MENQYQRLPTQDPEKEDDISSEKSASSPLHIGVQAKPSLNRRSSLGDIFSRMMMAQEQRGENLMEDLQHLHDERPVPHPVKVPEGSCCGVQGSILESMTFQVFMGMAIIGNALVIGFETDMPDLHMWDWVEAFFLFVFTGELVLRLSIHGFLDFFNFTNPDFTWNCFDFIIVSIGLFDSIKLIRSLLFPQEAHDSGGGFTTIFRIIRLLRILRIFRIVRFLKQLYMLVFGFGVAAIATGWVTILAVVIIYVCSIVMVRMVQISDPNDESYELYHDKFGSVGGSMFTLFQLMLNPDLSPYEDSLGRYLLIGAFLFAFVVFGSFGMLALLTGVISESMFEKNQVRLEEERGEREQKRKILAQVCGDMFDDISRGKDELAAESLKKFVPKLVEVFMKYGFPFTEYDLDAVFDVTDTDDSGGISKQEFVHAICSSSEGIKCATIMELHQSVALIGIRGEKRSQEVNLHLENIARMVASLQDRLGVDDAGARRSSLGAESDCNFRSSGMKATLDAIAIPMEDGSSKTEPFRSQIGTQSIYVGIDSKLALKIDACEAMVREMRRSTAEIAHSTKELLKINCTRSNNGYANDLHGSLVTNRCLNVGSDYRVGQSPDPWNELEFVAPLEISDMCDSRNSGCKQAQQHGTCH